jgi:hypothetical protein
MHQGEQWAELAKELGNADGAWVERKMHIVSKAFPLYFANVTIAE